MTESKSLKKPRLLQALALCFLVAPFGNILLSFVSNTTSAWYQPDVFIQLLGTIPALEWVWLTMLFACGILLLIQHKLSWAAATITLGVVLAVNAYKSFVLPSQMAHSLIPMEYQILFSVFVTAGILMTIFYARYPYLDRRDTWFGKATKRYSVKLKAQVQSEQKGSGWIVSISTSGARLQWTEALKASVLEEVTLNVPDMPVSPLKARVVENTSDTLRVRFLNITKEQQQLITAWLEKKDAA